MLTFAFLSLPLLRKTDVKIRKQTEKRETKRKQETVFYVFLRVSLANIGKLKLSLKALILSAFTFICFLVFSNAFCRTKIFKTSYYTVNYKKQLVSITEYASDGTHKNPTKFSWYNLENFKVTNVNYTRSSIIHKAMVTIGDFNGDGKADFIATPENRDAGWSGWKLFLSNGNSFYQAATGQFKLNGDIEQVVSGDFNGDGYDDIVIKRKFNDSYYDSDLYLSKVSATGISFLFSKCFLATQNKYTIQSVELNGDGAADIFAWYENSKKCDIIYSVSSSSSITPLGYKATRNCSVNFDRVEYGDFNGDGLTDVMNLDNNGYYLLQSDGYGTMSQVDSGKWPEKRHYINFGDFNGDGKTDLMLTGWENDPNKDGWTNWCLLSFKGNGDFDKFYFPRKFISKNKKLFITDINGDGFDDFYAIENQSDGNKMTIPSVYLNDGTGNSYSQTNGAATYAMDKWHFYMGDFNGDGKTDFLCTSDWNNSNWDGYQLFLMPENNVNLISGITDGLGNTTSISYKYLSDKSVYERGTSSVYPMSSIGSSWPVVSSTKTPNGIGGYNLTTYRYKNAMLHRRGRGLLGFEYVTIKDETNNTTTINLYEVNTDEYVIAQKYSETRIGNTLVNKSTADNKLFYQNFSYGNHVFTYIPVSTHEKSFEYNSGTLISDVTTTREYDKYGNSTKISTVSGDLTTENINKYINNESKWLLGRLTESTVTKNNSHGTITKKSRFEYDTSSGLLDTEYTEPDNPTLGYKKTYTHDAYGNIIRSTIVPNNNSVSITQSTSYDGNGRYITSTTDPLNFTKTNTIDTDYGVLLSSKDENGIVTTNTYDKFGRLLESHTPITSVQQMTGWNAGIADASSNALYFKYSKSTGEPFGLEFFDCLGRSVRKVTESYNGQKVYVDVVYNAKGQTEKTSEPYFPGNTVYWNTKEYDLSGRIVKQASPDGKSYSFQYNGLSTTTVDSLGNITTKKSDINGNMIESVDNNGTGVTYTYDVDGKCVVVKGSRTEMKSEYDIMGNRIKLIDPDLGTSEDVYNAYGEHTYHTDNKGTTKFVYDKGGRIISEQRPDMTITTSYDAKLKGYADRITSTNGTSQTFQYDNYGRMLSTTDVIDEHSFITSSTYNSLNKVDAVTYPSGLRTKNNYSENGMLTSVTNADTNYKYWELKTENARGQVEKELLGNGLLTTTTYNAQKGYVTNIVTPGVQNWQYAFNAVGNLTDRTDKTRSLTEHFDYDGLARLTKITRNRTVTQEISYDNAGNILSKTGVGTELSYKDGTNRLMTISGASYQPKLWDEIRYSSFDKITFLKQGNASMSLLYGVDESRVKSVITDNGNVETKYYVGNFYEESHKNNEITKINYIFANGKVIAIFENSSIHGDILRYLHRDHLGSVQAYSDTDGKLAQELSYDAWGRRRNPANWEYYSDIADANAWQERGFGGHEHVDIFEIVNMDGRMYDPVTGRFLSPDPIVQAADFSQSLNRYVYCLNNPLSLVDPSGYNWFSKNWKSLTAAVVGIAVSAVTLGSGTAIGTIIIAGAAGGAAGALTGSLLNGSNIGQIAKSTFMGTVWGTASSFLNYASGGGSFVEQLFKHSFSEAWLEGVQGGNMFHGMMMGAVSSSGSYGINRITEGEKAIKIVMSTALSGTVSEIGGGKFANGAVTGTFAIMFNDMMHEWQDKRRGTRDYIFHGKGMKNRIRAMKYMIKRSQYTGKEVMGAFLNNGDIVIFRDYLSTFTSCEESPNIQHFSDKNGLELNKYNGVGIKTYVHTHPYFDLNRNSDNPLYISPKDINNMGRYDGNINILLLNGDYYSQGTLSHQAIYSPNWKYNIYK